MTLSYFIATDNLARGQPTDQHRSRSPYISSRAVNGRYTDFTHTLDSNNGHWWKVDLGKTVSIARVLLYNRKNCCRKSSNECS